MNNVVLPLSRPALRYAVEICELYPKLKIGIAVADSDTLDKAVDVLTDFVDCVLLEYLSLSQPTKAITFKNGSRIDVLIPSDNTRGRRWNALVLDDKVEHKVYRNILRHCNTAIFPTEKC